MAGIENRLAPIWSGRHAARWSALILVQVLLLVAAYNAGQHTSPYTIRTGRAFMVGNEFSVTSGNWTYGGAYPENWHDDSGWHSGGVPSCVPSPGHAVANLRFAAVNKQSPEVGLRPVAWIDCSGSSAVPG